MKVVHVSESLPGGPATYLNELIRHQCKAYDEVTIICPEGQTDLIKDEAVRLVTFRKTGRNLSSLLDLYRVIGRELRRSKCDILHLHSSFAGVIGRLHLSHGRARIVYCPHGWSHAMKTSPLKKFAYRCVERVLSWNTGLVVNISKSEEALSRQAGIPAQKCATIYNGIQNLPWAPLPEGRQLKNLLFVGRYDLQKGVDLLAAAMERLGPMGYELTTVGGTVISEPMATAFPASVADLGWRQSEEIRALMGDADAVIMPSRWEGFSLVTLEAMRAGRPVIATRVSSLPEAVIDGECGVLCDPESPEALIQAVQRLASMDIRHLGVNARQRFEELFTSETMFQEMDASYRKLVRKGANSRLSASRAKVS